MKKLLLLLSFVFAIFIRIDSAWAIKIPTIELDDTLAFSCGSGTGPNGNRGFPLPVSNKTAIMPVADTCTPPSGYLFVNWECIDDSGNTYYFDPGDTWTISGLVGVCICTAQYQQGSGYTITYACGSGGGTAPGDSYYAAGATAMTASNTCTPPSGKMFAYWNCGGTNVNAGGTFTMPEDDVTCTAQYDDPPFSVTTSATNELKFDLSAQGAFYVDCGTGGTLSSDDSTANAMISGGTINKTDTTKYTFKCTYSDSAIRTIQFGGTATNYNTGTSTAAISFYAGNNNTAKAANAALITSISGNLSTIFPYISGNAADGAQPRFYQTFQGANITSIPETLFSGYTVASTYMFVSTFQNCTGLTSILENLFFPNATSVSGAESMFGNTFNGCTGLTSIPENLFSKITSGAYAMFASTFYGCTGLTSIPANLFSKITSGASNMFNFTFYGCTGLTSIPANLFSKITSGAEYMFGGTFYGCTGLTSIPENLFFPNATSVSGAYWMFFDTFRGCTGLTSIPANLFSKITSGAQNMFYYTFYGCSNLTGYIPPTLFDGLIKNNAVTDTFSDTFTNTGMLTSCPSGTTQYAASYTSSWGGKVSCQPNTISLTFDGGSPMSCNFGSTFVPPTPAARPGYVFTGWKIKKETCGINNLDTSTNGRGGKYAGYTSLTGDAGSKESNYGLTTGSGQWAVEFSYGAVWGMAKCSETSGNNSSNTWPESSKSDWLKTPSDTTGRYCWCQATGFTASGNSYTSGPQCTTSASSLWVFFIDFGSSDNCANDCADYCANYVQSDATFRTAVFNAVGQ